MLFFLVMLIMLAYYYFNLRKVAEEQADTYFNQLAYGMEQQVSGKLGEIDRVAKSCGYYSIVQKSLFSQFPNEKAKSINSAKEIVFTYKDSYKYIKDIFFYINFHSRFYTNTTYLRSFLQNLEQCGLEEDITLDHSIISGLDESANSPSLFFYHVPISNILNEGTAITPRNDAICSILCDMNQFITVPEEFSGDNTYYAIIYDGDIVSSNTQLNAEIATLIQGAVSSRKNTKPPKFVQINDTKCYYYHSDMGNTREFVCIAPAEATTETYIPARRGLYLIALIGFALTLSLLFFFMQRLSLAINSFVSTLNKMRTSSDKIRLKEPHAKEMKFLAQQINGMLDRIDNSAQQEQKTREQLYQLKIAQQESEMIAYRSQINPHFLFNTMECIRSMAQYYNAEPIEEIVSAMASLLRYSLYAKQNVPLNEEIQNVTHYLTILSIRFPDKYVFTPDISEEAGLREIPPMILQPIVENSIKHGFDGFIPTDGCKIAIKAAVVDYVLEISVRDNGKGIGKEKLAKIAEDFSVFKEEEKRDSIGLHNIYRRLKLTNDKNEMTIETEENSFTEIKISIVSDADGN